MTSLKHAYNLHKEGCHQTVHVLGTGNISGLQIERFLTALERVEEVFFYTPKSFNIKMDELYEHAELLEDTVLNR